MATPPQPLPILYSFRRCPYAIRARLALAVAGLRVEWREILLRDKPAEMLSISPKGTVPVLQCHDGTVIDESLDLMVWALQQNDPANWLPPVDSPQDLQTQALIADNDGAFKHWLDRYKYHSRHPERSQLDYRRQAEVLLKDWESRLQKHGGGLCDRQRGLADAAIFPFLRQFSGVEPVWWSTAPFPALRAWLQDWLNSALFRRVMRKQPPWQSGTRGLRCDWRQDPQ